MEETEMERSLDGESFRLQSDSKKVLASLMMKLPIQGVTHAAAKGVD